MVVTALGQERSKRALGYGVETIDGSIVRETGESNIVQTMAGKMSGVQVIQSSGAAGAASFIRIRGNATFTQNNQPLFVIDGVPVDNSQSRTEDLRAGVALSNRAIDINPDDIENISVLKGWCCCCSIWYTWSKRRDPDHNQERKLELWIQSELQLFDGDHPSQ